MSAVLQENQPLREKLQAGASMDAKQSLAESEDVTQEGDLQAAFERFRCASLGARPRRFFHFLFASHRRPCPLPQAQTAAGATLCEAAHGSGGGEQVGVVA